MRVHKSPRLGTLARFPARTTITDGHIFSVLLKYVQIICVDSEINISNSWKKINPESVMTQIFRQAATGPLPIGSLHRVTAATGPLPIERALKINTLDVQYGIPTSIFPYQLI